MAVFVANETCRVCLAVGEAHHSSRDICGDRSIAELMRKHLEIEIVGDEEIFVCCGCLHLLRDINKLRRVAEENSKVFQRQAFRREYEANTGDSSANTLFSPPMNHRCQPWPPGARALAYSTPIPMFAFEEPDNLRLLRDPMPHSPRIYESVWGSDVGDDSENCFEEENLMRSSRSTNSIDLPQYQTFRSFTSSVATVQHEPETNESTSESEESSDRQSSNEVVYAIRFG